eukprot:gene32801-biopygen13990
MFRVRWNDPYTAEDDTWEPVDDLLDLQAFAAFMRSDTWVAFVKENADAVQGWERIRMSVKSILKSSRRGELLMCIMTISILMGAAFIEVNTKGILHGTFNPAADFFTQPLTDIRDARVKASNYDSSAGCISEMVTLILFIVMGQGCTAMDDCAPQLSRIFDSCIVASDMVMRMAPLSCMPCNSSWDKAGTGMNNPVRQPVPEFNVIDSPDSQRDAAQERFKLLCAAYEALSDPDKREAYDRQHTPPLQPASMEDAWVVFSRVVIESVKEEMQISDDTAPTALKLIDSLLLPAAGFYFGGLSGVFASNALSILLINPHGLTNVWRNMTPEQKREFQAAVFCLARQRSEGA